MKVDNELAFSEDIRTSTAKANSVIGSTTTQRNRSIGESPRRSLMIPYELQKLADYNERLRAVELTTLGVIRDRVDLIDANLQA